MKGEKESNGLIENAVMLLRGGASGLSSVTLGQEPLSDESLILPCLVEHAGFLVSRCQKARDGKTTCERLHWKKPTQEFVLFGEKVLAKQISTNMQMVCSELAKSEGWNLRADGTKKPSIMFLSYPGE